MNIIITSLDETQWQDLRNLRLEALNTDPLAFGASFEEEADLPNDMWQKFSQNMLVAICDNKLIGMVGLLPQEEKSCKHWGIVISLWVKSGFR